VAMSVVLEFLLYNWLFLSLFCLCHN
jgi:hypothetical protein